MLAVLDGALPADAPVNRPRTVTHGDDSNIPGEGAESILRRNAKQAEHRSGGASHAGAGGLSHPWTRARLAARALHEKTIAMLGVREGEGDELLSTPEGVFRVLAEASGLDADIGSI